MSKITSVEPQKKNLKRFNIFLDGQFAFGADEDLVVEKRLVVGKEISTDELEKLLVEAEVGKLMERMYRLFGIRMRSEKELRDYFRTKNYELILRLRSGQGIKGKEQVSGLAVELVIKKLKHKGLLNDEEFAKTWVESRSRKKGPRVLKQELFQKGIDREIIEEVVSRQSSVVREEQTAQYLLEKKIRVWKNLPTLEFKKKAYDFLFRRGFEYEVVKSVVEKFLKKE